MVWPHSSPPPQSCAIWREQRVISPQPLLLPLCSSHWNTPTALAAGSTVSIHCSSRVRSGQLRVGAVSLETLRVTACQRQWLCSSSAVDATDFMCPSTPLCARPCARPPAQQGTRQTHLCPPRVMSSPALQDAENPDGLADGGEKELSGVRG